MKAKELIPAFAEITGMPFESLKVADRALADAGLRQKGRGPTPPDMTRDDVIMLLLGAFGSRVLSRANEYAEDAAKFRVYAVESSVHTGTKETVFEQLTGLPLAAVHPADTRADGLPLLAVLFALCGHVAKPGYAEQHLGGLGDTVKLEIEMGSFVTLTVGDMAGEVKLHFSGAVDAQGQPGVRRIAMVSQHVLAWIGQNSGAQG